MAIQKYAHWADACGPESGLPMLVACNRPEAFEAL